MDKKSRNAINYPMENSLAKILVQADQLSKSFGGEGLYENVNFSIYESEKIALYGPNGSGKSSLFKMLTGEDEITSGEFHKSNGIVISYLRQSHKEGLELSASDYLAKKEPNLKPWEVKKISAGLGFSDDLYSNTLQSLSGGYRMRFYLACELARNPDLLLLDEPTNHLDLESVLFLENYLRSYSKSFVLISHDRELIENICDTCLVIENKEILKYKGSLEAYFEFSKIQKEQKERENKKIEDKKKHLEAFVERFRAKATKAKQAQSKMKQIAKLDSIHNIPIDYFPALPIPQAKSTGKIILESFCKNGLGYSIEKNILKEFDFHLFRGDKIGIVGANGAGKSTLLKYLAGLLKDQDQNTPKYYKNVEASYFAQHLEQELPLQKNLLDYISSKIPKDIPEQDILNLLGSMGFSDQDWDKKIDKFSGGEKMRIVLGEILLKKQALLLLDEPTNHLDFQTVESLAQGLKNTDCTVVLVSHDRSFVDQVCDKIFEIKNNELRIYPGSYQEYIWSHKNQQVDENFLKERPEIGKLNKSSESTKPNYKKERKTLEKNIRETKKSLEELEKNLENFDKELDELNIKLSNEPKDAANIAKKLSDLGQKKEASEMLYFEKMEALEQEESKLSQLIGQS